MPCWGGGKDMARRWTEADIVFLRYWYPVAGPASCAALLNRSHATVVHRACAIGVSAVFWTDEEIAILQKYYPAEGSVGCARRLRRSMSAIQTRARQLGLRTKRKNGRRCTPEILRRVDSCRVVAVCSRHGEAIHYVQPGKGPQCEECRRAYARPEKGRRQAREAKRRQLADPVYACAHRLRILLRGIWKSRQGRFRHLRYSPEDLCRHVESVRRRQGNKCPSCGASYDQTGFHIDHVIPIRAANTVTDVLELFALSNLSLLCPRCNARKGARMPSDTAGSSARLLGAGKSRRRP